MKNKYLIIAISLFFSIVFIDETGVGVILLTMQKSLNSSNYAAQWIMNGFFLSLGVFVLPAGKFGDLIGYRRSFNIGVLVFFIGSLICGCSYSSELMIVGRIIQGLGAAFMISNYAVLIDIVVPFENRGQVLGTSVSIGSLFLAIGPFLGGFFVTLLNWRLMFLLNIPISILIFYYINKSVPHDKKPMKLFSFPWGFASLFITGTSLLIYLLMDLQTLDHVSNTFIVEILFSLIIIGFFCWTQEKAKEPLFNTKLFANEKFLLANLILFTIQIPVMSITYWAIWYQDSLHFSPLLTGVALLPAGIPILIFARFGGVLADKKGFQFPILYGAILVFLGMLLFCLTAQYEIYFVSMIAIILYGIGAPLVISPAIRAVFINTPVQQIGMGSGVLNTSRQLGATVCFAVVGTTINFYFKNSVGNITYTKSFQYGMYVVCIMSIITLIAAIRLFKMWICSFNLKTRPFLFSSL